MTPLKMRITRQTFQTFMAFAFLLLGVQSVMAQQWPVGQAPVENAVPQYRPQSVPTNPPIAQPSALPLDYFSGPDAPTLPLTQRIIDPVLRQPGSRRPAVNPPVLEQPVLEQPVLEQPVLEQPVLEQTVPKQPVPAPPNTLQPEIFNPQVTAPRQTPFMIEPARTETIPKPIAKKKAATKKVVKTKQKVKPKPEPVLNNEIYRDQSVYPIDPRKPNWPCGGGNCQQGCRCQSCLALGNQGRPFHEKALGGCKCDTRKPTKHPNFSVHWPRPFSAKLDARHPEAANARYAACQPKRIVDVFDGLSTFKLSKYKRTDNGYCGPGCDPYGCLGESKLR